MVKLLIIFVMFGLSLAVPAKKELFDKASADDVDINSVHSNEIIRVGSEDRKTLEGSTPTVISETVIDSEIPPAPSHPGTSFARIIDDIFQIPITVLQSVAKLLSNPFKAPIHPSPENSSKY